eukprot:scaffold13787_cov59-Attheya_sp.AAC.5
MVDFAPYYGDFSNVVRRNVINAQGAEIHIGMGMGSRLWHCLDPNIPKDEEPLLFGAGVMENTLKGKYMQYGFAVNGVRDWNITGNLGYAEHGGMPTISCNGRYPSAPRPFQVDRVHSTGLFQDEFEDASLDSALEAIPLTCSAGYTNPQGTTFADQLMGLTKEASSSLRKAKHCRLTEACSLSRATCLDIA